MLWTLDEGDVGIFSLLVTHSGFFSSFHRRRPRVIHETHLRDDHRVRIIRAAYNERITTRLGTERCTRVKGCAGATKRRKWKYNDFHGDHCGGGEISRSGVCNFFPPCAIVDRAVPNVKGCQIQKRTCVSVPAFRLSLSSYVLCVYCLSKDCVFVAACLKFFPGDRFVSKISLEKINTSKTFRFPREPNRK